ncbi:MULTISPECIES: class I SAM-dependent methyltransferase [unclassified Streptomyces]|uniref:class I SAM-dependent methyltransferase n=1 Tax=unclassified Streptomyces TaxID=2593676 RepID=UPI0028C378D2|nr:class I SAM-dependent methyltransferase [Streptomyces sp. AM8-1-1]WNO76740.1 class I SAM-dependent methyltransferase [Streptomyces sp. AM8-1-1]
MSTGHEGPESERWLADTRASYDADATSYADEVRNLLAELPAEREAMALFAEWVLARGGGPVADVGCGPGRITAHLRNLGVDAFGIDLSPRMIEVARREHPGLRFEVGSMTQLDLADGTLAALVAWYSIIHVPDDAIGAVLAGFRRVLRPGGLLLLGFHVGDASPPKPREDGESWPESYVRRRRPSQVAAWLDEAGFIVETHPTLTSAARTLGGVLLARR